MIDFQEFKSRPTTVMARKVDEPETVVTVNGLRSAVPGQYVTQVMALQIQQVPQDDGSTQPEEVEYCCGFDVVDGVEFEAVYSRPAKRSVPVKS